MVKHSFVDDLAEDSNESEEDEDDEDEVGSLDDFIDDSEEDSDEESGGHSAVHHDYHEDADAMVRYCKANSRQQAQRQPETSDESDPESEDESNGTANDTGGAGPSSAQPRRARSEVQPTAGYRRTIGDGGSLDPQLAAEIVAEADRKRSALSDQFYTVRVAILFKSVCRPYLCSPHGRNAPPPDRSLGPGQGLGTHRASRELT